MKDTYETTFSENEGEIIEDVPKANRRYKDTVFRMLFSDKVNLLSLYNAVTGKHYDNPEELRIVTLKNAIYMGMKNDLAFIVETSIFLYEHQATINPNIPLRDLFYIAMEYHKLVGKRTLYSSALQKIPAPKFVVFYNGTDEMGECKEYRLSDAYESNSCEPSLELKVTMLNVNEGHNEELMKQCATLKEYAQYVSRVRHYAAVMELDVAVKRAIDECIKEGILMDFLSANRSEVELTSLFEYNKEEEEKKLRKAEYELGVEKGEEKGQVKTMLRAVEKLVTNKGFSEQEACEALDYSPEEYEVAKKSYFDK